MLVYTKNVDGKILRSDTTELLQELMLEYMNVDMSSMTTMSESFGFSSDSPMMSMFSGGASSNLWEEMLAGDDGAAISDVLKNQYDVVYGDWPHNYNEIVLVLDENNELNDMALYALGLTSEEEAANMIKAATNQEEVKRNTEIFRGQIIDVTPSIYTVQLAGTSDKLDAFLGTLREVAKIVEVARSGVVGLSRGDKIMR